MTCSVTTHVLKRFLKLFAPTDAPATGPEKWAETRQNCSNWAEAKGSRLAQWSDSREEFLKAEEYNLRLGELLDGLTGAGLKARRSIDNLEKLYEPTDSQISAVKEKGFDLDRKKLQSHTYVSPKVMAELDEIYRRHYPSGGPLALRQCFAMTMPSESSADNLARYQRYLGEVKAKLVELSLAPASQAALLGHDLQTFGLKHAAEKLEPLFGAVFGRICLPLPTRTMLDDLRGCLNVGEEIMGEVLCSYVRTVICC